MSLTTPVAGAYTSVYNSLPLAYTRQGYNLNFSQKGERIEESDLYGKCLLEIIGQGAQLSIDATFMVYSAAVVGAMWPWIGGGSFGTVYTPLYPISGQATQNGHAFVLTAVAGTPVANGPGPQTVTANPAIIAPDQNTQLTFGSMARMVPLRFDVMISDSGGTGSLLTVT